jgi:HPt (histidine-containing phosphotransfer) domain-containing protein
MITESGNNFPVDLETAKSRVMGDMDFLKEMLAMFEESIPTFLEALHDAIEHRDAPTLSRAAHQLKGAALNLSVLQVAEKAADLDELGRTADFEKTEAALKALELAVSEFREFMEKGLW